MPGTDADSVPALAEGLFGGKSSIVLEGCAENGLALANKLAQDFSAFSLIGKATAEVEASAVVRSARLCSGIGVCATLTGVREPTDRRIPDLAPATPHPNARATTTIIEAFTLLLDGPYPQMLAESYPFPQLRIRTSVQPFA